VTSYIPGCYSTSSPGNTQCVPQATTATTGKRIDSVGDRMMFHFSYRNFGSYQSYLASHTVQVAAGTRTQTGIRWYELRGNGNSDNLSIGHASSRHDFVSLHAQHRAG